MSRDVRGKVAPGSEWWGKRPIRYVYKGDKWTSWWKRRLHKIERRQGKSETVRARREQG